VFIIDIVRAGTTLLREERDASSIVKKLSCIVIRSLAIVAGSNIYVTTAVN
jgi:hypothetical protein